MFFCQQYEKGTDKNMVTSFLNQMKKKPIQALNEDSYVVYEQNLVIAVVSFYQSYYHPHVMYCSPYFLNGEKRIEQIFKVVKKEAGVKKPIQILFDEREVWTNIPLSFKQIRTTYIARLSLEQWSYKPELILTKQRKVNELTDQEKQAYQKLVAETYKKTHLANPVRALTDMEWSKLVFAEDLRLDDSLIQIDNGVQAYVRCHSTDHADEVELGWLGERNESQLVIYELLQSVFNRLKHKRVRAIEVELDSTDAVAIRALAAFPFDVQTRLVTLQEKQL